MRFIPSLLVFTDINASGHRTLKEGDLVEFEVGESGKGPKAIGVEVIQSAS